MCLGVLVADTTFTYGIQAGLIQRPATGMRPALRQEPKLLTTIKRPLSSMPGNFYAGMEIYGAQYLP